ncbi:putative MFS monosaccharide transporter [Tilletiaria anomala UBC 951]|uniref:Putative MFS monosaccharide transporter n=1 Tax=Tilletiaria anomala (strain ATCC 24038 / CBS 436.72 / UBC 951) TaxID=1037660 RepID=A0A066WFQ5_TILAU|nr:putative MFS monosaccharide transporter [Tilletiaria anomala UBC 951]KDN52636.1 putative MFS monosaccharide transporter [Tilletiaria anomala UBC 951]
MKPAAAESKMDHVAHSSDTSFVNMAMDRPANAVDASLNSMDPKQFRKIQALAKDPERMAEAYGAHVGTLQAVLENKYVVACALFASLSGLCFGVDQGIMSVTLVMPHFLEQFPKTDSSVTSSAGLYKGIITAFLELGAIIGAVLAGYVADRFGRKFSIRVGFVWFVIGAVLQTASFDYPQLVAGRTVSGLGIGLLSASAPLYMAEVSPPHIRGVILAGEEFAIVFGICIAFYVTYGTRYIESDWSFRGPFILQMVPAFLLIALSFLLPESPRWLASRPGRLEEALATIALLRQRPETDELVQAEFLEIRAQIEVHEEIRGERHPEYMDGSMKSSFMLEIWAWLDCFRSGCSKRTWLGILLMFFQQMVGINSLIYYSPSLFAQLGLTYELQLQMSGVVNLAQLVGVMISFVVIDRLGRRPLLLGGSAGMTATLVIVAALVAKFNGQWASHSAEGWAGVAMLCLYMVVFGISWGPIPWSMPSEIFPQSLRSKGVAYSVVSNWLFNFVVGLITPVLVQNTGYGAFVFFACFSFLSIIWAWFFVPEIAGIKLEDMDRIFGDRTGAADKERFERIEQRLAAEAQARVWPNAGAGPGAAANAGSGSRDDDLRKKL